MNISYLGPVSCVFTSWVSSGLTIGSGCTLMAARWQVFFPSWISSGLTSSLLSVAAIADDWHTLFTDLSGNIPFLILKNKIRGTLPNSFYEVINTLVPKLDKYSRRKENYRPIFLMNIDTKVLNKILANHMQQRVKRIYIPWTWYIFPKYANVVQHLKISVVHHINILQ